MLKKINKQYKIGDSVSIYYNQELLVNGIIYIIGSVPMNKFYRRQYGKNLNSPFYDDYESDTYEDAIVLIDNKNAESLIVITLEENNYKLFNWKDVIENKSNDFSFINIVDPDKLIILRNPAILTEIKPEFK